MQIDKKGIMSKEVKYGDYVIVGNLKEGDRFVVFPSAVIGTIKDDPSKKYYVDIEWEDTAFDAFVTPNVVVRQVL